MTLEQKMQIEAMRLNGESYGKIAKALNINRESVKAYCRRHGYQKDDLTGFNKCPQCGTTLVQIEGRKPKKFCSDACRMEWWNKHQAASICKEKNRKLCEYCGKEYYSNKASSRFCSCKCFADYRRSGGITNVEEANTDSQDIEPQAIEPTETDVEGSDPKREELPPVQPHPKCDECPWFIIGQRMLEITQAVAKAVQTADSEFGDKEQTQWKE